MLDGQTFAIAGLQQQHDELADCRKIPGIGDHPRFSAFAVQEQVGEQGSDRAGRDVITPQAISSPGTTPGDDHAASTPEPFSRRVREQAGRFAAAGFTPAR